MHFSIFKKNLQLKKDQPELIKRYAVYFEASLLATDPKDIEKYNQLFKTEYKEIYQNSTKFNEIVADYKSLIEETNILILFDKYLKIDNLDE